MYNNPFYGTQANLDKINAQINELEKMRTQLQQPIQQPTSLTQNFQIAPTNRETIRYANSMDEVKRDMVVGDIPYFSKDMSIVWIKNTKGEIKTYELTEIVEKDEKDMKIELLQARISELERKVINEPSNEYDDKSIKNEKSTNVQEIRANKKK